MYDRVSDYPSSNNMSALPEKVVSSDGIQSEDTLELSGPTATSRQESITIKSRLLGAAPDEVLEAAEYGQTLDLAEAKKVSYPSHGSAITFYLYKPSEPRASFTSMKTIPTSIRTPSSVSNLSSQTQSYSKIQRNMQTSSPISRPKFPSSPSTRHTPKSVPL